MYGSGWSKMAALRNVGQSKDAERTSYSLIISMIFGPKDDSSSRTLSYEKHFVCFIEILVVLIATDEYKFRGSF